MTLHAADVIVRPVISEKSMDQTQHGKYTFRVHRDANKHQIKAAVEELFKVTVLDVNVLTTKPHEKRRMTGRNRQTGYTVPWRKAIVTLSADDKIEFFEGV
jgi:large subunit ribosomal protein L23